MDSVELYRTLDCGWVECGGLRLASSDGALGGDAAPGGLGEDVRAAARAAVRRGGAGALPAHDHRRRARRVVAADRRLPRPEPAHLRARRGRARGRLRHPHEHARDRDRRARRARARACRPSAATSRPTSWSTPAACSRPRSGGWPACACRSCRWRTSTSSPSRSATADRSEPLPTMRDPDLLIYFREDAGGLVMGGYERHSDAVGARRGRRRRHPRRLQRPPARGGLGALRGDHRQRPQARAGDGRGHDHAADQRARGVHARRRVPARRVARARVLRRRRLLRPRARGRGRDGQADGGVDRRGRAVARRVGDGHAALRRALPLARLHAEAHARGLRDLLRHQVPRPRAPGGAPAARLAGLRLARGPRRRVRGEVGLGARQLVRGQRGGAATRRCARAAGPGSTGRPRSAPSTPPRARRPRCSTRPRSRSWRSAGRAPPSCSSGCATTASSAGRARSPTRRCSTAAAGSSATSRSRSSRRSASGSSPAPRSAPTTAPGSPRTRATACWWRTSRRAGPASGCGARAPATSSPPARPTRSTSAT